MGQRTGYCWAPDDSAIAYKRFDEAPVPIVRRVEIFAERTDIIEQRYPAAGEPNVLVQLFIVTPESGVQRHVDLGIDTDIYLVRADWSADSRTLLYQRQSRDQKRLDLIAVDCATLAQRTVLSETSSTWVSIHDDLRFLKRRNALLWTSERSGRNHLYLVDLDHALENQLDQDVHTLQPISNGDWGIDNVLAIDEEAGHVFVASNRDAIIDKQVYRLDYRLNHRLDSDQKNTGDAIGQAVRITTGDGWHDAVFAANGAVFVDTFSHPDLPPQVSLRSPDGALIGWLEHNELNAEHPYAPYQQAHLTTEYGTLTSNDGQTLHYSLLKPGNFDASMRYPVFLSTYGGPHAQHVAQRWGNLFDQFMAQQGFVVFRLDNRGSSRRERVFTDAIHRHLGACEVADQLVGVTWLAQQDFVDSKRIGVFGWSYGGFMALRLLAEASDQIAIGVAVAPVTDWALYDTHYTEQFMGMPDDNVEGYKNSSVYAHLDGLRSPLLLMHGMADDNVLFSNTTRMIAALVERGVQFDLMAYPGAKHGISSRVEQRHVFGMIASFFDQHLKRAHQPN
jgi:dipeptidyl-peptidase-4